MSDFLIRPMLDSDLDQVMDNENAAYDFPWTRGIFENNLKRHYAIVAVNTKSQQLMGHALLSIVLDEAHVLNIAVAPLGQRRGIGRALLEDILAYGRENHCLEAFLEVRESNRPAFSLYHSLGFNEIGVRKNYYPAKGGKEDAILLACAL